MSRGMELVAIRMSHTCVMPSTLVHWGVSSVMPWTMWTGPLAVIIVKIRRPNSSNGWMRSGWPTALTDEPPRATRWRMENFSSTCRFSSWRTSRTSRSEKKVRRRSSSKRRMLSIASLPSALRLWARRRGRQLCRLSAQHAAVFQHDFGRQRSANRTANADQRQEQLPTDANAVAADRLHEITSSVPCPAIVHHCDSVRRQVKSEKPATVRRAFRRHRLDSDLADSQNWENWQKQTMHHSPIPSRPVVAILLAGILLPIALCVVLGVAALLARMGDSAGGAVLYRIALAGGILWVLDLICLVLVLAIDSLRGPDEPDETP